MHELSLAQDILRAVLKGVGKAGGGKRIKEIHVRLRESVHHMENSSLETCLEVVTKGTIAEGAVMKTELIPPTLRCQECDFTFLAEEGALVCPRCRSGKLEELDADKIDLECSFAE